MQSFEQRSDTKVFDEPIYLCQKTEEKQASQANPAEAKTNFDDYLSPILTTDTALIESCNNEIQKLIGQNEKEAQEENGGIYYYKHNAKLLSFKQQLIYYLIL